MLGQFLFSLITQIKYNKNYTTQNSFINNNNNKIKINNNRKKNLNFLFINQTTNFKLHEKMSYDESSEIFMNFNKLTNSFLIFMNINWVIHYDINPDVKEYINRMGRTSRLDKGENSLIFIMNNEKKNN